MTAKVTGFLTTMTMMRNAIDKICGLIVSPAIADSPRVGLIQQWSELMISETRQRSETRQNSCKNKI